MRRIASIAVLACTVVAGLPALGRAAEPVYVDRFDDGYDPSFWHPPVTTGGGVMVGFRNRHAFMRWPSSTHSQPFDPQAALVARCAIAGDFDLRFPFFDMPYAQLRFTVNLYSTDYWVGWERVGWPPGYPDYAYLAPSGGYWLDPYTDFGPDHGALRITRIGDRFTMWYLTDDGWVAGAQPTGTRSDVTLVIAGRIPGWGGGPSGDLSFDDVEVTSGRLVCPEPATISVRAGTDRIVRSSLIAADRIGVPGRTVSFTACPRTGVRPLCTTGSATTARDGTAEWTIPDGDTLLPGSYTVTATAGTLTAGDTFGAGVPHERGTPEPFDRDLIVNGGAEDDPGATDTTTIVTPSGWTPLPGVNLTALRYGAMPYLPDVTDPAPPRHGDNLFGGGCCGGYAGGYQDVDVSQASDAIDAGTVRYDLSGWLGGSEALDTDVERGGPASLQAVFLDASGATIGRDPAVATHPFDRGGRTGLVRRNAAGTVPAGTRTIRVELVLSNASRYGVPPYIAAFADDIGLVLTGPVRKTGRAVSATGDTGDVATYDAATSASADGSARVVTTSGASTAEAGVVLQTIATPAGAVIEVRGAHAEAHATRTGVWGAGRVASITVDGLPLAGLEGAPPNTGIELPGGGRIVLNAQTATGDGLRVDAVRLERPGADPVAVASARAGAV